MMFVVVVVESGTEMTGCDHWVVSELMLLLL